MSVIKTSLKRTPFNLPPPWSSKMAVPQNVVDEGLERRAFVTQWAPRGTFDNPAVGTGGYVVPEYVTKERYGRGTFVTAWAPRGSYFGPGLPNWLNYPTSKLASAQRIGGGQVEYVMDSLSGDEAVATGNGALPGPIEAYGQQAASAVLRHAASYPPNRRKAALKNVMDKIDTSLWSRSAKIAKRYESQGMPSAVALHQGIARAFGAGMIAELVKTGQSGKAPPAKGQLGLGCYAHSYGRPSAMGSTAVPMASTLQSSAAVSLAQQAVSSATAACGNPIPGFTWVPATSTVAGHWERQRAGVTPNPNPVSGCYTLTTRVDAGPPPVLPSTLNQPAPQQRMLQVGPFLIDATPGVHILGASVRDNRTGQMVGQSPWVGISQDWRNKIGNEIVKQWQLLFANRKISQEAPDLVPASELGITVPPLFSPVPGGISQDDLTNSVIKPMQKGSSTREQLAQPGWVPLYLFPTKLPASGVPLFKATHPDTGEVYGLWLYPGGEIQGGGASNVNGEPSLRKDADGYHMAGPIRIFWGPIHSPNPNWFDKAFGAFTDFISDIGAFIADAASAVGTALKDVADAACALLSSPAAGKAAAVGAVAAGAPPAAGAGGAALAQQATGCHGGSTPSQVVQQTPSYVLPLAIGAIAIGAIIVLTTPKSQKGP